MGCCSTKAAPASAAEKRAEIKEGAFGALGDRIQSTLSATGIQPLVTGTRQLEKNAVMRQRQLSQSSFSQHSPTSGTRIALTPVSRPPVSHRMSRIGTITRNLLVKQIEDVASEPTLHRDASVGTASGLTQRLRSLGLASVEMMGDGNCQFRAVSDQLFGSQEHHGFVRSVAIAHMRDVAPDFFGIYFESASEYAAYLADMGRLRTWGDELTMRACVEAFGCIAHIVTSTPSNWYLVYQPEALPDEQALAALCKRKGVRAPRAKKQIFISYISPIHYNAIAALSQSPV